MFLTLRGMLETFGLYVRNISEAPRKGLLKGDYGI